MSTAPDLSAALAGAGRPGPASAPAPAATALVAGAAGRLGERVLARLLAAPEYRRIYALSSIPMPSTESRLTAVASPEWNFSVDHVVAVVEEQGGFEMRGRKRTDVFVPLSREQVLPLAQRARAAGVRRFVVVTPIHVLSQPAALYAALSDSMEAELNLIGFESLVLIRPSDQSLRRRSAGLPRRLFNLLVDTASGLLVGLRHTPLTIEDTARAVVRAMQESPAGLSIIETDRLHGLLKS